MDSSATSSSLGIGNNLRKLQLREVSIRFLIFGFREFGPACEAFLGRPETVVQGAARMRRGGNMEEVALALVYREARYTPPVREELAAWLAFRLLQRGHRGVARALRNFPATDGQALADHLLGPKARLLTGGSFPGPDALVDKFASLLETFPPVRPLFKAERLESLVRAMFLLSAPDREVLRRTLAGEDAAHIGDVMGWSVTMAERTVARVLYNARRRVRKAPQ